MASLAAATQAGCTQAGSTQAGGTQAGGTLAMPCAWHAAAARPGGNAVAGTCWRVRTCSFVNVALFGARFGLSCVVSEVQGGS